MGGFDDLEDAVADEDEPDSEPETPVTDNDAGSETGPPTTASSSDETTTSSSGADSESGAGVEEGSESSTPAFEFDATSQKQMYTRPEVWSEWEDLRKFEVERELVDRGIRNVAGRELDEAALRVLMEHPEEVADYVEAARRDDL